MREPLAPALDGEALWPLAQEQAKERQGRPDQPRSEKFTEHTSTGETRDQIGEVVKMSDSQKRKVLRF